MYRIVAMFVVALALSGCLSQQMDAGLKSVVGQKISKAEDRLGYPDGQSRTENGTIYVWSSTHNVTTTGMVGSVPVHGMGNATSYAGANDTCTVQIDTDLNDTIRSYQWSGNGYLCSHYVLTP